MFLDICNTKLGSRTLFIFYKVCFETVLLFCLVWSQYRQYNYSINCIIIVPKERMDPSLQPSGTSDFHSVFHRQPMQFPLNCGSSQSWDQYQRSMILGILTYYTPTLSTCQIGSSKNFRQQEAHFKPSFPSLLVKLSMSLAQLSSSLFSIFKKIILG